MRSEKMVLSELIRWASGEPAARAMLLTGSRASDPALVDLLSDYDITLVVNPLSAFRPYQWLSIFGTITAKISEDAPDHLTRLVLYDDGVRIDFQIYECEEFRKKIHVPISTSEWDIGWKMLLDKDSLTTSMQPATYKRFRIHLPTRDAYHRLINDFWWDTTYVAKSLWRGELFFAKYMFDAVIRHSYLKSMIEWYIGMNGDWKVLARNQGRSFQSALDAQTWSSIEASFAGSNLKENWEALFAMTGLFSAMAKEIGAHINSEYPQELEDRILKYLSRIRKLDRGANDF